MRNENRNWFSRNRGFVFGFAVAILLLNLVIFALVPQQTSIFFDETVMEYWLEDETVAIPHTVQLTGTLSQSMFSKPVFDGTLCVSGIDALASPVRLQLTRKDGRWDANFYDDNGQALVPAQYGLASLDADKELAEPVLCLLPNTQHTGFLAPGALNRTVALTRLYSYYPSYRTK